jgi:glycosyltransferase involved in cell wall biosynthesis
MSNNGFEVLCVSSYGHELEKLELTERVKVKAIELTRIISPIKDLKSLCSFFKICLLERPLIVHSHTPKAGLIGMLGAMLAGVPIRLHTVAGLPLMEAMGWKRKLLVLAEKLTYLCATKVYPNSKGLYDFIIKHRYTSRNKLKVICQGSSNGIDTSFFNPTHFTTCQVEGLRKKLGISPNDFVFIFVGRLVGDKGINELVEAFYCFDAPNLKLLLVGPFEKELDPLYSSTIQAIQENPNIILLGFQEDVRPFFAISNCLVFPSYREGFPNVVMQAGAMGLPSIVTNINGCNEIIVEDENGSLIKAKSIEALFNSMRKMYIDVHYYNNLKQKSRLLTQTRYEQQMVWKALLDEYNMLLRDTKSNV